MKKHLLLPAIISLFLLPALPVLAFDPMDGKGEDEIVPIQAEATSVLYEPGFNHEPDCLFDYDWDTGWTEGNPGTGAGGSVTLTFSPGQSISGFSLLPGYWKSEKLFYQNAAPTLLRLRMGDYTETFDLSGILEYDETAPRPGYYFPLSEPLGTDLPLTVTIRSVREGSRYEDCVITELHFWGQMPYSGLSSSQGYEILPGSIEATSILQEEGYDHGPWNLFDNDSSTAWTEGESGSGEGEMLTFYFEPGTILTGASVLPGFRKSERLFYQNAAPTFLQVSSGYHAFLLDLAPDAWDYTALPPEGRYQPFPEPLLLEGPVYVTVDEVREGSVYEDCAISELHFYGWEGDVPLDAWDQAEVWEEDGWADQMAKSASDLLPLSEPEYWTLAGLCEKLYHRWNDYQSSLLTMSLSPWDLTAEEQAFVLYWYLYEHREDGRVWEEEYEPESLFISEVGARGVLQELFGLAEDEDDAWDVFTDLYCTRVSDGIAVFPGTGDFGAGGPLLFFPEKDYELWGERLCLSGEVRLWDNAAGTYVPRGEFEAYFLPSGGSALYGWRFDGMTVTEY